MAYVITPACVGVCDTACVDVCPMDCIHGPLSLEEFRAAQDLPAEEKDAILAGQQMYIDPSACIDCDACLPMCPVQAIYRDEEVPAELSDSIEENARFFDS